MSNELQDAIALIRSGDEQLGAQRLAELLKADPENETAWLWMSSIVTTDEQRRHCLEQVLILNPDNQAARKGLVELIEPRPIEQPEVTPAPTPALETELEPPTPMSRLAELQQQFEEQLEPAEPEPPTPSPHPVELPQQLEEPPGPVEAPLPVEVEPEPPTPISRLAELQQQFEEQLEPAEPEPPTPSPRPVELPQHLEETPEPVEAPLPVEAEPEPPTPISRLAELQPQFEEQLEPAEPEPPTPSPHPVDLPQQIEERFEPVEPEPSILSSRLAELQQQLDDHLESTEVPQEASAAQPEVEAKPSKEPPRTSKTQPKQKLWFIGCLALIVATGLCAVVLWAMVILSPSLQF